MIVDKIRGSTMISSPSADVKVTQTTVQPVIKKSSGRGR